jgi:uncharacterized protein YbaA (DUF1428 family)
MEKECRPLRPQQSIAACSIISATMPFDGKRMIYGGLTPLVDA